MSELERANLFLEQGDLKESFKILTNYIDTRSKKDLSSGQSSDDELAEAYNTRGHIRYLWVDFDEAISDYTNAIKRKSNFDVAYYNRGQVHYRLGRYQLADRDLTKALELNPNFKDAERNLEQVRTDVNRGHRFNTADQFQKH